MQTLKPGEAASRRPTITTTMVKVKGLGPHGPEQITMAWPGSPHSKKLLRLPSFLQDNQRMRQQQLRVPVVSGAQLGQSLSHSVLFENTHNYKRYPRCQKAERRCEHEGRAAVSNLTSSTLKTECTFPVFSSYPLPPDSAQSTTLL